jgi:phospholipid transport system substrate-binding protein
MDRPVSKNVLIALMIISCLPSLTYGEQPLDVLRSSIAEGIRILKSPHYQDSSRKDLQRQRLCEAAWQIFDFEAFSRLVLASNWRMFAARQRDEFTDAFARFLCRYYLSRLQQQYNGEEIVYVSQDLISDTKALIKVKVLWKGLEVPVKIRMLKRNGAWRVYDVNALGISAVLSYREQFRALLRKDSPSRVIELIEDRLKR